MATAAPVEWRVADGGNGQVYEAILVPGGTTWQDAREAALLRGGDLVSIESAAELDFVFGLIDSPEYWYPTMGGQNIGPWIGAFRTAADESFKWVSAEPFAFTNWSGGSPSTASGFREGIFYATTAPGRAKLWLDVDELIGTNGYIVEFAPQGGGGMNCGVMGCAPSSPMGLVATPLVLLAWGWTMRRRWRRNQQELDNPPCAQAK